MIQELITQVVDDPQIYTPDIYKYGIFRWKYGINGKCRQNASTFMLF